MCVRLYICMLPLVHVIKCLIKQNTNQPIRKRTTIWHHRVQFTEWPYWSRIPWEQPNQHSIVCSTQR